MSKILKGLAALLVLAVAAAAGGLLWLRGFCPPGQA